MPLSAVRVVGGHFITEAYYTGPRCGVHLRGFRYLAGLFSLAQEKLLSALAGLVHRVSSLSTPSPPLLRVAKIGKNHLNEEITHFLPTGIGERFSQTISNLGHAALLLRCELPL